MVVCIHCWKGGNKKTLDCINKDGMTSNREYAWEKVSNGTGREAEVKNKEKAHYMGDISRWMGPPTSRLSYTSSDALLQTAVADLAAQTVLVYRSRAKFWQPSGIMLQSIVLGIGGKNKNNLHLGAVQCNGHRIQGYHSRFHWMVAWLSETDSIQRRDWSIPCRSDDFSVRASFDELLTLFFFSGCVQ